MRPRKNVMRGLAAAGLLLLTSLSWVVSCRLIPDPPRLTVMFLDVGQGDTVFVRTPGGRTMLVDAGPATEDSSEGMRTVLPRLRSLGVQSLNAVVLTHPDEDHIGGARDILDRMPARRLFCGAEPPPNETMREVHRTAESRGIERTPLYRGQTIDFQDGVTAVVVGPGVSDRFERDNDRSIALRLQYGRTSILLTGDAEAQAEASMVASGMDLRSDVLKLGHHGSRTSTTASFVRAVQPQACVVSCGKRNAFGHPHPDVTTRIAETGAQLFRTDMDGAIVLVSDGRTIRIRRTLRR